MKPAPFQYYAPTKVEEALNYLSQHGSDAKVLAGGQSLIPAMNFRLAQPAVLIDLNKIGDMFYIRHTKELLIGAMTRKSEAETNPLVAQYAPLLTETIPFIAHPQIRNRGTMGGSIAHADPASELPAVTIALDARFRLRSVKGERWVLAEKFFLESFTTAMEPNELLMEIAIPPLTARTGCAFAEISRRRGDYALVGVTAVVTMDKKNHVQKTRIVFLSVGSVPLEARQCQQLLTGQTPTVELLRQAADIASNRDIDPGSDIHASAEYRRQLARVLTERVLHRAVERAQKNV